MQHSVRMLAIVACLLWSLVEVNSQTFPYVSFMGQTLTNHSYVNLSLVTTDGVQCHTDLSTCCTKYQGTHRGDWYFPSGERLQFYNEIYQDRNAQRVDLRRISATSPTGIYRCDIDIHDNDTTRKTVYLGLYANANGGGLC